jgi:hypothetical protein
MSALRRLALAALLVLAAPVARAQMAIIAPTAPNSDISDKIVNTQWINNLFTGGTFNLTVNSLTVNAISTFTGLATFNGGMTVTGLVTINGLTIDLTGNLATKGNVSAGSLTINGVRQPAFSIAPFGSNGGAVAWTPFGNLQVVQSPFPNKIWMSGMGSASPFWSQTTWSDNYAASSLLFSNGPNNIQGLATCNGGVFITSSTGTPSCSTSGIPITAGGTGASTVVGARSNLFIDQRTPVNDANYTMLSTDYQIAYTTITAARTVTLLAASSLNAGRQLIIRDDSGFANGTNTISVTPNGADKINGLNATRAVITSNFGSVVIESDGSSNWSLSPYPGTCAPVKTILTSGTNATFTVPACDGARAVALDIELWGGGGGGAGSGSTPGAATAGGNTCWNTSGTACTSPVYVANGGGPGQTAGGVAAGGTATGCDENLTGGDGTSAIGTANVPAQAASGAAPKMGTFGRTGVASQAGGNAPVNSGGGGGGAGSGANANTGGGAAGGGYCGVTLSNPAASYVYTIGAAGSGGSAGTGGFLGGNGGAGYGKVVARWQ